MKHFKINLNESLVANDILIIHDLELDFSSQTFDVAEDFWLQTNVNNNVGTDYDMDIYDTDGNIDDDVYIRVGQPAIDSSSDHVFITHENEGELTEDIEICAGSTTTINADDNLYITSKNYKELTYVFKNLLDFKYYKINTTSKIDNTTIEVLPHKTNSIKSSQVFL